MSISFYIFKINCFPFYLQNQQFCLSVVMHSDLGHDTRFCRSEESEEENGKEKGMSHTSDHTPASHTVMQSWPSQRWAVAGFGPRQSLSQALISVPLFSCWVQATCLLCTPFPHVREHVVHSVIIHLKAKQRSLETN